MLRLQPLRVVVRRWIVQKRIGYYARSGNADPEIGDRVADRVANHNLGFGLRVAYSRPDSKKHRLAGAERANAARIADIDAVDRCRIQSVGCEPLAANTGHGQIFDEEIMPVRSLTKIRFLFVGCPAEF